MWLTVRVPTLDVYVQLALQCRVTTRVGSKKVMRSHEGCVLSPAEGVDIMGSGSAHSNVDAQPNKQ